MIQHQKQQDFLQGKFQAGRLSHAYLFSGQPGIGKKAFAKRFIQFLNCLGTEKACGACQNCILIEKESFPDLITINSRQSDSSVKNEKDMMEIDVGQMREVNRFLSLKSYYGNYKAVIIEDADRMNAEAQNTFLKTLEEPKGKTIIILVSSKSSTLLPTIFSRCQTIAFFPFQTYTAPNQDQKLMQELLPIITSELATKFQYTKKVNLEGDNAHTILEILQRYFRTALLIKIGVLKGENMPQLAQYSVEKLQQIIRLAGSLHHQLLTTNANPKLALEILLLEL